MNTHNLNVDPRVVIDASGLGFRDLNARIRALIAQGEHTIELHNVNGQYYLGAGLTEPEVTIYVYGVPGNDLGVFMGKGGQGPTIRLSGNGQDNVANTMSGGKIIIPGRAGSVLGYGMRGGRLYLGGDVGERVGIHMKGFPTSWPAIIVGGRARDFLGEYMAGGIIVVLGLEDSGPLARNYLGTGMHGGAIYLRTAQVEPHTLGKEVAAVELDAEDHRLLDDLLADYCQELGPSFSEIRSGPFLKVRPTGTRPYGMQYTRIRHH